MAGLTIYIDDKDLVKAQKGKETDIDKSISNMYDAMKFIDEYYKSEGFENRVKKENEALTRHGIGYNINPNSIIASDYNLHSADQLRNEYQSFNSNGQITIGIKNNPNANGTAHEIGHSSKFWNTSLNGTSNKEDIKYSPYYHNDYRNTGSWKFILEPNNNAKTSHDRDLSESYSDLLELRYWLQKNGYFDNNNPNDVMTKERMYDILKNNGVIFDNNNKYKGYDNRAYKIPFSVRRFLINHEPEQIIDALNLVAENNTNELDKAQLGGWIKKAYRWITDEDARNAPTYDSGTFEEAFADAKKKGVKTFYWNNDYYNTNEKYYYDAPGMIGNTFAQAYNNAKEHWGFQNAINRDYEGHNETRNMFNWNGKTYKVPEETVKDKYERITGLDWNTARKYGFTDGSYKQNMLLNNGLDDIDLHGMEYDNIELPEDGKINNRPDLFAKLYATYLGNKFYEDTQGKNEQMWKLPVDMNNTIILTKSGKNTGTKVPVDLLDYIMEFAERTNTPLEIAFGLPAQESAFGLNDAKGKRNVFIDEGNGNTFIDLIGLYSNWAYSNDNPAYGYVNSKNAKADNFKYSINIDDFLNKIEERKNTEIPVHAYGLYSKGNYNSLDKSHSPMVWQRGSDFINSPEFKKYLEDYKRRKNNDIEGNKIKLQQGGPLEILNQVNRSNSNFVQRLKDPNRQTIKNWENRHRVATHKLSVGTDENGNYFVYPEVQEINGKLVDFTRPKFGKWSGQFSAIQNQDTVRFDNFDDALWFTQNYKNYYPSFDKYQNGGQTGLTIFIDDEQFKKGGQIHIKEKNKGKFTKQAQSAGMSVQEFARHVLAHKDKYPASTVKRANFARNASKWSK